MLLHVLTGDFTATRKFVVKSLFEQFRSKSCCEIFFQLLVLKTTSSLIQNFEMTSQNKKT
jgi:hypothetical protein